MNSASFIDLYCERTGPELWNEPLNAISNLAFLLAAFLAWRLLKRQPHGDPWALLVIVLAGSIGIGSLLFHTVAQHWAELSDTISIWSFVFAYVLLTIYRSTAEDVWKTVRIALIASAVAAFLVHYSGSDISTGSDAERGLFNGSIQYAPALAALVVFTVLAHIRSHPARRAMLVASLLFTASLVFRSIDLISCEATGGHGTHFLWHLLNAGMIYVLLKGMVLKMPPANANVVTD